MKTGKPGNDLQMGPNTLLLYTLYSPSFSYILYHQEQLKYNQGYINNTNKTQNAEPTYSDLLIFISGTKIQSFRRVGHRFFSKECSVLCVFFRSFQKNVPFFAFFSVLLKRTFSSLRSFPFF